MKKFKIVLILSIFVMILLLACSYISLSSKEKEIILKRDNLYNELLKLPKESKVISKFLDAVKDINGNEAEYRERILVSWEKINNTSDLSEKCLEFEEYRDALNELENFVVNNNKNYISKNDLNDFNNIIDNVVLLRGKYNSGIKDFNNTIKVFPSNIVAKILGIDKKYTSVSIKFDPNANIPMVKEAIGFSSFGKLYIKLVSLIIFLIIVFVIGFVIGLICKKNKFKLICKKCILVCFIFLIFLCIIAQIARIFDYQVFKCTYYINY